MMGCMVLKNLNHSNFTPNIISRRMISVVSLLEGRGRGGRDKTSGKFNLPEKNIGSAKHFSCYEQ